jgi:light-regulated signal transduction histidine kinase (bacteriophytochrome)
VSAAGTIDLRDRIRELERSNTELEQFAYVASHDLQEPVRTVQTCLEMFVARYGDQLDEGAMAFIRHATDASEHMRTLLDDLLAYARIGRGASGGDAVDLNRTIPAIVGTMDLADKDVVVRVNPLPVVRGNRAELELVFRNVLANAVKFRRAEGPLELDITAEASGDRRIVTVVDNGIGIAESDREAVFEMFRRLHPRSRYPGTGMGLALCRRVVENINGRIWAEASPSGGTAMRVELPAMEEER